MGKTSIDLEELERFLNAVGNAQSIETLKGLVYQQIQQQGFEFYSYQLIRQPHGPRPLIYLTCYKKDWTIRYLEKKYIREDLVSRHAAVTNLPFVWDKIVPDRFLTDVQKAMFNEGAECGLKSGGTIPLHGPGSAKALFAVASNVPNEEFAKKFLLERHQLHIIATYLHERLLQLNAYNTEPPATSLKLSQRELEVLTWTSGGKTTSEISTILSLSEATVGQYVKSACNRLDAMNKAHAVAIALLHGLIVP